MRRHRDHLARDLKPAAEEHRAIQRVNPARDPQPSRAVMLEHLRRAEGAQTEGDQLARLVARRALRLPLGR